MKRQHSVIRNTMFSSLLPAILATAGGPAIWAEKVCDLITQSEASAGVGASVSAGMPSAGESGDHLCRYVSPRQGMLAITLAETNGRDKYEKAKAKLQTDSGLTPENVSGLGDQAVFATISKGVSELFVLKGDKSIAIALSGRAGNSSKEMLKELAQKALSRL